jgi:Ras-related GTP-binding protein A/B
VTDLERQLNEFALLNSAEEVVIFERTTFLVICKSDVDGIEPKKLSEARRKEIEMDNEGFPPSEVGKNGKGSGNLEGEGDNDRELYPGRFGKISQQVKELRVSCS